MLAWWSVSKEGYVFLGDKIFYSFKVVQDAFYLYTNLMRSVSAGSLVCFKGGTDVDVLRTLVRLHTVLRAGYRAAQGVGLGRSYSNTYFYRVTSSS